ncbi:MAG: alpha/beta fold hydrolase [Parahaliea sp.]
MTGDQMNYQSINYYSPGGLQLYARDYQHAGTDAPVVLCLHGLTRNSADFELVAAYLADRYRLICPDQRGRGRSSYDPQPANYQPQIYVEDMFSLLDQLRLQQVIIIGTSMGGLMGMMMGAMQPRRIRALVLNDIGPEVDPVGLARIKDHAGRQAPVLSWAEAVAQTRQTQGAQFPDLNDAQWQAFARTLYHEQNGVPVLAYDPAIALPFASQEEAAVPPDLWPMFESLTMPVLVLRGETSDILASTCARQMLVRSRHCHLVEVSQRGHAPMLDEPLARTAIEEFLAVV